MTHSAAAVMGLGAVGRHVAVLLTTQGVRRLQLVDDGIVRRADIAAAGYRAVDVDRPKADAVLGACFEIEPRLLAGELIGAIRRDLSTLTGDLFCCERPDAERLLAECHDDQAVFCAIVRTTIDAAEILCSSTRRELRQLVLRHPASHTTSTPSLCDGTLVGSLVIRQYLRYLSGRPFDTAATFDFRTGIYIAELSHD